MPSFELEQLATVSQIGLHVQMVAIGEQMQKKLSNLDLRLLSIMINILISKFNLPDLQLHLITQLSSQLQ